MCARTGESSYTHPIFSVAGIIVIRSKKRKQMNQPEVERMKCNFKHRGSPELLQFLAAFRLLSLESSHAEIDRVVRSSSRADTAGAEGQASYLRGVFTHLSLDHR